MVEEKRSIIFYGAGKYARKNITVWKANGLVPVCFADANENKHFTKFESEGDNEGYTIFPLNEAIKHYPDYLLYLTLSPNLLRSVTDWLIAKGIPAERIKYADGIEWRKGCGLILRSFHLAEKHVRTCCCFHNLIVPHNGNVQHAYKKYLEEFGKLYKDIKEGKPNHCIGCPSLREGFYPINPQITSISFDTGYDGDVCNFNCSYCNWIKEVKRRSHEKKFIDIFREVVNIFDDFKNMRIFIAVGEITISPWRDEVLSYLKNKKWYVTIHTNGSVFNEDMAEMIKNGYMTLKISVDAGTKETFRKLHGVDCFEKVVNNLKKYSLYGSSVVLKYILMDGINTNKADVDGFLEIARQTGFSVRIDNNILTNHKSISTETMDIISYFIQKMYLLKIPLNAFTFFNSHDRDAINKIIDNVKSSHKENIPNNMD